MRPRPRPVVSGLSVALATVALVVFASVASAQAVRLSTRTLSADSLDAPQVDDIKKWAAHYTDILLRSDDPAAVADARQNLVQPLNNTLTKPVPRGVIVKEIAERIPDAIKSDSLSVRLNALIVASESPHPAIAPMIVPGLEDASPAVRYWAAKACAQVMGFRFDGKPVFDDPQQEKILASIIKMAPKEASDSVLDQMFQALASLTIQPAREALFGILRQRVASHIPQANPGLRADKEALNKLHQKLVLDVANGRDVGIALRELTAVTAQFLQIASRDLASGKADAVMEPLLAEVADTAQKVFTLAVNQLAPQLEKRPVVTAKGGAAELQLATSDWVGNEQAPGILTSSPIAIPYEKLRLPGKAVAPAPAPAPAP